MLNNSLILIGMPASGKSTLGALLADALQAEFLDTDLVLEEQAGKPLQQILNDEGIDQFLQREEAALCSITARGAVIATGGSAVYSAPAMAHLKTLGPCIYLAVPYTSIEARLQNLTTRGVAIARGKTLRQLYDERIPLYERYADVTFQEEAGRDLACEAHAQKLLDQLEQGGYLARSEP